MHQKNMPLKGLSGASPETVVLDSSFGLRVSSYLVVSVDSDSFMKTGRTNLSCSQVHVRFISRVLSKIRKQIIFIPTGGLASLTPNYLLRNLSLFCYTRRFKRKPTILHKLVPLTCNDRRNKPQFSLLPSNSRGRQVSYHLSIILCENLGNNLFCLLFHQLLFPILFWGLASGGRSVGGRCAALPFLGKPILGGRRSNPLYYTYRVSSHIDIMLICT